MCLGVQGWFGFVLILNSDSESRNSWKQDGDPSHSMRYCASLSQLQTYHTLTQDPIGDISGVDITLIRNDDYEFVIKEQITGLRTSFVRHILQLSSCTHVCTV